MSSITLDYTPRAWQKECHVKKQRFSVYALHRRSGKTELAIMELIDKAIKTDKELMTRFTYTSRFLGARAIAAEALELVDTIPPVIGEGDNARMDNAHVNWMRSRADLRLKLLSKWYPQEYGDKVGIDAKGDINLTISTGIPQG